MNALQALTHVANLFAPALGLGLIAAAGMKLLWRRDLRGVRWGRLALAASGAAAVATVAGLVLLGRDGAMATYAAMVIAAAGVLYWCGFLHPRRAG